MTPAERATVLAESQCPHAHRSLALVATASDCSTCIAEQIGAAIAEEREACARVATSFDTNNPENQYEHDWPAQIADAIRART